MHAGRLIRRHYAEGLEPAEELRLRRHLRGCDRCRAEYDALGAVLSVAAGREPTARQNADAWRRLERALAGGDAGREVQQPDRLGFEWALQRLLPAVAVATVLVVAALGSIGGNGGADGPAPGVQHRGGTVALRLTDLEVFAVHQTSGGDWSQPRLLDDGARLTLETFVQLRYRNQDPELAHLWVVALDRDQVPLDYFPRPGQSRSVRVGSGPAALALGRSIRLQVRHQPGPLRVVAIFSARALTRAQVHQALTRPALRSARGVEGVAGSVARELGRDSKVVAIVRSFVIAGSADAGVDR